MNYPLFCISISKLMSLFLFLLADNATFQFCTLPTAFFDFLIWLSVISSPHFTALLRSCPQCTGSLLSRGTGGQRERRWLAGSTLHSRPYGWCVDAMMVIHCYLHCNCTSRSTGRAKRNTNFPHCRSGATSQLKKQGS